MTADAPPYDDDSQPDRRAPATLPRCPRCGEPDDVTRTPPPAPMPYWCGRCNLCYRGSLAEWEDEANRRAAHNNQLSAGKNRDHQ